jgi:L-fucose isomerase-like protein
MDEYQRTAVDDEVQAMAADYTRRARRQVGATKEDMINGVRSYVVARTILKREQGDAITMDCLGALGRTKISLPCIAWSKMNDDGVPAGCEADLGAVATHCIVQYLFDRPGFQQNPVAETARQAIIGAHCSCPTKLRGFSESPEPFDLLHHHGMRDAVPRTI